MAVAELKKELERVVEALVEEDEDDYNLEATDNAIQTLCALKDLKLKQNDQEFVKLKNLAFQEPPPEFKCPISGILMKDPVVLASGQTYEETFIRKWLKDGHQTCPQTDQPLSHTVLIPNLSIKKMITKWYQRNAAKELRSLTTRSPSFRALFGEIKVAIPKLFSPLLIDKAFSDARLHDDLAATVLNIATHESNKRAIVESSPLAVSFLIVSLRHKNIQTRNHAVAALSELSTLDSNKHVIGKSGAIRPLIELLKEGHDPLALKDVVSTIFNLCTVIENRAIAVSEGAVVVIIDKIFDCVFINEMLELLAMLSSHQRAIDEMEERGMLFCLFGILKETTTSNRNKELCVAIIYAVCFSDRSKLRKISEMENAYEILSRVARTGSSRAKRKATVILERLNSAFHLQDMYNNADIFQNV
ncbi:hypothetical protein DH2020_021723 [Rehmannia glutinosa]|uniref:RING-type E3 ubiquitin transferase n=1 Tax=Rehmannia glutinosa TaxID=99300 RepID=A0ABR0WDI6_REHGL